VVLVLVLLAGAWPHLYAAFLWPESRDAVVWITHSAVSTPGWAHWVFLDNHFVAYRPVTAFSYTLDSLFGVTAPLPYRMTDLAAHLACAVGLYVLARRLAPKLSPWGAVAAVALFVLHPVSGLVVPHLARRAYSLSTALAVAALAVYAGRGRWRAIVGALLLGLAALANEAAYAAFPAAALLSWFRGSLRAMLPAVLVGLGLLGLRMAIRGNVGGYEGDGSALWMPIVSTVWTGVIGADVLRSGAAPLPAGLPVLLLIAVVAGLVWPMFVRRGGWSDEARASALGWVWLAVLTVVFAPQGVFFPRQLYVVAAPYALVVGLAWATAYAGRGPSAAVLGVAAALATALVVWQSPVLLGPDPIQRASWVRHDRLVRDIDAAVADLPLDATVLPVVPYYVRPEIERFRVREEDERAIGRQGFTWVSALRGTKFTTPVTILHEALDTAPSATLERTPEGVVVRVPAGAAIGSQPRDVTIETRADGTRLVRPIVDTGRHPPAYLYFHDGLAGELVPLGDRL
jgi:hypothetical protein